MQKHTEDTAWSTFLLIDPTLFYWSAGGGNETLWRGRLLASKHGWKGFRFQTLGFAKIFRGMHWSPLFRLQNTHRCFGEYKWMDLFEWIVTVRFDQIPSALLLFALLLFLNLLLSIRCIIFERCFRGVCTVRWIKIEQGNTAVFCPFILCNTMDRSPVHHQVNTQTISCLLNPVEQFWHFRMKLLKNMSLKQLDNQFSVSCYSYLWFMFLPPAHLPLKASQTAGFHLLTLCDISTLPLTGDLDISPSSDSVKCKSGRRNPENISVLLCAVLCMQREWGSERGGCAMMCERPLWEDTCVGV